MTIIVAIRSPHVAVVGSDLQRVSPSGISEAPYDKTFQVNSLIGAHAGLLEFAGLDLKVHIANALAANHLPPHDAVRTIDAHVRPILQSVSESEVAFEFRIVDIIVASRPQLASVRLTPNITLRQIEAEFNENSFWLVAGDDLAKAEAMRVFSKLKSVGFFGREKLRALALNAIASSIDAGGPNRYHPSVPSCCRPVCLRHIR